MDSLFDAVSTLFDIDSDSPTEAAAWASSPLGDPDGEFVSEEADEAAA